MTPLHQTSPNDLLREEIAQSLASALRLARAVAVQLESLHAAHANLPPTTIRNQTAEICACLSITHRFANMANSFATLLDLQHEQGGPTP